MSEKKFSYSPKGLPQVKGLRAERMGRIIKVREMIELGAKTSEIAQVLGISQRMVQMDLVASKQLNREMVGSIDQGETLGAEIAFWLQICRQAMRDYNRAQSENAKIGFLRVASEASSKFNKLLQDYGLIKKVPERLALETKIPFEDPEVRKAYLDFLILARGKGEKNLGI
jgi:plasmid maintenance system antidote protein VapI